jgi:hypothetical protein
VEFTPSLEGIMPRHVEYHPYAVQPVQPRPGVDAKESGTPGRPFADLLADAEAVRDPVLITAPAHAAMPGRTTLSAGGLVAAATGLWHGLGGLGLAGRIRKEQAEADAGHSGTSSVDG